MNGLGTLVFVVLVLAGLQGRDEARCTYTHREACDKDGCRPMPLGDMFLVVPQMRDFLDAGSRIRNGEPPVTIRRCDQNGCTPVAVNAAVSGGFINVWKLDGGYMLKLAVGGAAGDPGDFVEIATLWTQAFVSYGNCPWSR